MDERLIAIAKYFGVEIQEEKLMEECSELIQAVAKLHGKLLQIAKDQTNDKEAEYDKLELDDLVGNVVEEMADVQILIQQIAFLYEAEAELDYDIEYKINRTINRIKNGYYE